jgi:hypothetical protein
MAVDTDILEAAPRSRPKIGVSIVDLGLVYRTEVKVCASARRDGFPEVVYLSNLLRQIQQQDETLQTVHPSVRKQTHPFVTVARRMMLFL